MRRQTRKAVWLAILSIFAPLVMIISPGVASADSIPTLKWPAVSAGTYAWNEEPVVSPQGDVTLPCVRRPDSTYSNLRTYDNSGSLTREFIPSTQVNGVDNCIWAPVVDKNGDLYGAADGGSHLLAYSGSTLKWSYQHSCLPNQGARFAVGADGNIYTITSGNRLVGLSPNIQPGQSQPATVLDIPTVGQCGDEIRAYKDGIAVIWNYGQRLHYYSYNGKDLGEPVGAYGTDTHFPINAEGRLFFPTYVPGTNTSVNISAYDPHPYGNKVAWTTPASTPGANVQFSMQYPLPDGGVVAAIREQKMVSGIPAFPEEYVTSIVAINATGSKIRTTELPNTDGDAYFPNDSHFAVDVNGKLVVVRTLEKYVSVPGQSGNLPIVTVGVIDPYTADVPYYEKMEGNYNPDNGDVYGYKAGFTSDDMSIGSGAVYLNTRKCWKTSSCTAGTEQLHPVAISGLGMDYPRGAVLAMNTALPPTAAYVALGDSYSSGEGVEPFIDGNYCHRSTIAYSQLVSKNPNSRAHLVADGFKACSGAVTGNIWSQSQVSTSPPINEPLQDVSLGATTEVVSLTIGGNDMGFGLFGEACFYDTCNYSSGAYSGAIDAINNVLPAKLEDTYKSILNSARNADIYVLGYPQVAPVKDGLDPNDPRCFYLYNSGFDSTGTIPKHWEDAQAARDIVDKLNLKIEDVVREVRLANNDNARLHFVDVNGEGSPFIGHEMCSTGDSYFHNIDQAAVDDRYALHPNEKGQEAYAQILADAIAG